MGFFKKAPCPAVTRKKKNWYFFLFFRKLVLEDFLELGAQIFTEFEYHAETFENEVFDVISRVKKIQKNMNLTMDFWRFGIHRESH